MENASRESSHDHLWRLGEILVRKGCIQWSDLEDALALQQSTRRPLGEILIQRGLITPHILFQTLAAQFGKKFLELKSFRIQQEAVQIVPKHFAYEHKIMPLAVHKGVLIIAVSDPVDVWPISVLEKLTGMKDIQTVLSTPQDIEEHILKHYGQEGLSIQL